MTCSPLAASCDRSFPAAHFSGVRAMSRLKWIVLHSTEGPTAAGAAAWIADPRSTGSAHLVVDDDHCFRCLSDSVTPWAAPGANENGLHLEQAGYARWTRAEWREHENELHRAAYRIAVWAALYSIPLRWVGPVGLRVGRRGLTTHRSLSYAWPLQARRAGFHTDPGTGYPKDILLAYAKRYAAQLERGAT